MREAALEGDVHLSGFNKDISYVTPVVLRKAKERFNLAARAVAGDPVLSARVERERIPLDYACFLI